MISTPNLRVFEEHYKLYIMVTSMVQRSEKAKRCDLPIELRNAMVIVAAFEGGDKDKKTR